MSPYEQNLAAFIELLNNRESSLFSAEYRAELAQLIEPLPDDIKELANVIAAWHKNRPEIRKAQLDLLNKNPTSSEKAPGSQTGNIKEPEKQLNKEVLKNAIQQSSVIRNFPSSPTGK